MLEQIKAYEATSEDIKCLKSNGLLELPWMCDESDWLYIFKINDCVCAALNMTLDPCEKEIIWIDEFEVIRSYRKQKIGNTIIKDLLKSVDVEIKLLAKNKVVAEFWHKCGFKYDWDLWNEIQMSFIKKMD